MEKDTIDELFSDGVPFDETAVVKTLKPYVNIQKSTNKIFLNNVDKLSAKNKILLYSLAKKLLKFSNHIDDETISALEFFNKTKIKKGTIDFAFKDLRDEGLLIGSGSSYEIPNLKISEILTRFDKVKKS